VKIREAEKNEREKENQSSALERKSERKQNNFYAKLSEIKRTMFSKQPMIVLLYKEALLNTNELDLALPSFYCFSFVPGATIPNRPA
jgi:hypothetical protein